MAIKVTVKLDNAKFRVYLKSNDLTIGEIEHYLKKQSYKNVKECLDFVEKTRHRHPSGYRIPNYSMAYIIDGTGNEKSLLIEAWLPITEHFNDYTLDTAINDLIMPVLQPTVEDIVPPQPNIKVSDLKNRHYVTVFEQDEATLSNVLSLVQNFETLITNIRNKVGIETDKIPSEVLVDFSSISQASHSSGLAVFGLMPASTVSSKSSGSITRQDSVVGSSYYSVVG